MRRCSLDFKDGDCKECGGDGSCPTCRGSKEHPKIKDCKCPTCCRSGNEEGLCPFRKKMAIA